MDNKQIARILRDTAQLLEIDGAIIGRYRSYEKAAELIDSLPESIEQLVKEPEKLEELPGIGERMVEHLQEIVNTGDYSLRKKLLKKYPLTILDVLQLQSLGPKKVAFLWSNFKAATVADVERLAREQKLRDLPGFGEKILKFPDIDQKLAHGENKVSFTLTNGLQVDVRLLEKENFGAALMYFTGSKEHNVALRGRANDMGLTLNEYALATLKGEKPV